MQKIYKIKLYNMSNNRINRMNLEKEAKVLMQMQI